MTESSGMDLEAAVRDLWSAQSDLQSLLPVEHLTYGPPLDDVWPQGRLRRRSTVRAQQTTAGRLVEVRLHVDLRGPDVARLRPIADAARRTLDRKSVTLDGAPAIAVWERTDEAVSDNGIWTIAIELVVTQLAATSEGASA